VYLEHFDFFLQTSQVVPYADSLSFDKTIQAIQSQTMFNSSEVLDKHKMLPLLIVCPPLKIGWQGFIMAFPTTSSFRLFLTQLEKFPSGLECTLYSGLSA
jgi:hypothetical protein